MNFLKKLGPISRGAKTKELIFLFKAQYIGQINIMQL